MMSLFQINVITDKKFIFDLPKEKESRVVFKIITKYVTETS